MYIIQKVKTKTNKKAIMVYDSKGLLKYFKPYQFNSNSEAIEEIKHIKKVKNIELMEEIHIDTKEYNWYKKSDYAK